MARNPRVHIPGRYYHVILKGNDKQDIFFCNSDRIRMCLLIQAGIERYDHNVHAFCFMSNHIHLLIEVNKEPLSKIVQNIAFRYAAYINYKYKRVGHLFQGRFRSIILDQEGYFLRLLRYIHLNPVRAGLVQDPMNYLWSSHRSYLGVETISWVKTSWGLSKFAKKYSEAHKCYHNFMRKDTEEESEEIFQKGIKKGILGSDDFIEKSEIQYTIESETPYVPFEEVRAKVSTHFELSKEDLSSPSRVVKLNLARATLCFLAREFSRMSIKQIADELQRDPSSLSALMNRYFQHPQKSHVFTKNLEEIRESFPVSHV